MVGGCVNEYWGKGTLLVHGVRERGISEKVVEKQGGNIKGIRTSVNIRKTLRVIRGFRTIQAFSEGLPGFQDNPT